MRRDCGWFRDANVTLGMLLQHVVREDDDAVFERTRGGQ